MTVPAPVTLATILNQFRDDARNNRDLGDRFERLIARFFEVDPIYSDRFSDVWLWNEWPDKGNRGDIGIDLVKRVVRVSLETMKIVARLPGLNER
jgi:predicted helicase